MSVVYQTLDIRDEDLDNVDYIKSRANKILLMTIKVLE